ncbi:MAG: hypothetical protein MJ195_01155 [Mycoplasmoidaceae bacterium]|nr:hypothetical protein [Mycoplasmoidaceae bacterium]
MIPLNIRAPITFHHCSLLKPKASEYPRENIQDIGKKIAQFNEIPDVSFVFRHLIN